MTICTLRVQIVMQCSRIEMTAMSWDQDATPPDAPTPAWWGYGAAVVGVALVSAIIGLVLSWARIANVSMLYLLVVLALGTRFGSGPAVMASVLAFLTFNWFFVGPVHTLTVTDPDEWLALLLLLGTSVVTGQLTAGQRRR